MEDIIELFEEYGYKVIDHERHTRCWLTDKEIDVETWLLWQKEWDSQVSLSYDHRWDESECEWPRRSTSCDVDTIREMLEDTKQDREYVA